MQNKASLPVIKRLPKYYRYLDQHGRQQLAVAKQQFANLGKQHIHLVADAFGRAGSAGYSGLLELQPL